jgi:hypothetical protein
MRRLNLNDASPPERGRNAACRPDPALKKARQPSGQAAGFRVSAEGGAQRRSGYGGRAVSAPAEMPEVFHLSPVLRRTVRSDLRQELAVARTDRRKRICALLNVSQACRAEP